MFSPVTYTLDSAIVPDVSLSVLMDRAEKYLLFKDRPGFPDTYDVEYELTSEEAYNAFCKNRN